MWRKVPHLSAGFPSQTSTPVAPPSKLAEVRLREGLTISALARAANLSAKTVSKCEKGRGPVAATTKHRVVNALNALAGGKHYGVGEVFPEPAPNELSAPEPSSPEFPPPPTEATRKNIAWLDEYGGLLDEYGDAWVAICDGHPVSSGETPRDAWGGDSGPLALPSVLGYTGELPRERRPRNVFLGFAGILDRAKLVLDYPSGSFVLSFGASQ